MTRRRWFELTLASALATGTALAQAPLGLGQVVILVGAPGTGKTLQARNLSKKYKIPAISVSDLIRQEMNRKGGKDDPLAAVLAGGELLDDEGAIRMVSARIGRPDAGKGFVLDGYPASEGQAKFLDDFVGQHSFAPPKIVVLEAPDDVVRARLLKRKRADDTPENISRRLKEFHVEEKFLSSWYKPENTVRVDASQAPEVVFKSIEEGLIGLFSKKQFKTR